MSPDPTKSTLAHQQESTTKIPIVFDLEAILAEIEIAVKRYPMKALADDMGKRYGTLANELSDQPGWKLGFADALKIIALTRCESAVDFIESGLGRVAFRLPRATESGLPVMTLNSQIMKEFGEHMEMLAAVLEDGNINQEERRMCLKELRDVIVACLQMQGYLEQVAR